MAFINHEVWQKGEDGKMVLVSTTQVEVNEPTQEELVAEKEQQLLAIYEELQALKNQQ